MDFGLGLVLSFTDNASAGMNSAVQSLNNLTSVAESASNSMSGLNSTASLIATSTSANMLGNSFIKAGTGMLGMFNTLISKTQQLGSEYENFGVTLSALGMNAEEAISKLFKFANKSPLEVGDVKDMIVTLQAQGINAFDETTGAISGTRQEFLAFLTDLKSFKPEVAGMRFNMAIQNYIGSGEKKQMRTVFDMGDIEDIIGHAVSDTAEGRMQDIVEMVEKKGLTGLSASLANTWSGVASNVSDAFTRIFYSVANDGGVFEKLKQSFIDLAQVIIDLPEEDLANLGRTIGDALNTIVTPLTKIVGVVKNVITSMIELAQTHPALLKWGIVLTTVAGIVTVLTGVVFKIVGAFANFTLVMQSLGLTITKVSTMFKSGFATMASSILPLVAVMGLLALAWKTDFGGIRTMTTNFINNIVNSWQTARNAVDGSVQGLRNILNSLRSKDDFWSNITIGFMQIYGTFKFLAEAWNSYELSDESFQKAQELGILPLVTAILMLKWRFEQFVKGFKQGLGEVSDYVQGVISKIAPKLKGTIFQGMIDKATEFFQLFTGGDGKDWENFGNSIAHFTAKAIALGITFKVLSSVIVKVVAGAKILKTIFSSFNSFINVFGKILRPLREIKGILSGQALVPSSKLGQAFVKIIPKILKVKDAIMGIVSLISSIGAGPVLAIVAVVALAIGGIVAFAKTQKDKFTAMIDSIKETFSSAIENVKSRFQVGMNFLKSTLGPTIDNIKDAIGNIKEAFSNMGDGMKDSPIIQYLGLIGQSIMTKVVPIINFLITLVGSILGNAFVLLSGIISGVVSIIGNLFSGLVNVISGIVNVIAGLLSLDFKKVGKGLMQIVNGLIQAVGGIIGGILTALGSLVTAVFGIGKDIVLGLINGIKQYISGVVDLFKSVIDWVKGIFGVHSPSTVFAEIGTFLVQGLINGINAIIDLVLSPFKLILSTIKNLFKAMPQFFSSIWSKVSNTTVKVWNSIKQTVTNVSNSVKGTISTVWNGIKSTFSNVGSTIKSTVSSVFNGVKSSISGAMSSAQKTVQGAISKISSFFSNAKLSLPHIKVPHFKISGGQSPWGIGGKGTKPTISVDWYAKGGVFDKPSVIGVGENGKEAVMPLENNLGWIDGLASMISNKMGSSSDTATPKTVVTPMTTPNNVSNNNTITKSVTNNNNNTSTVTNNSDNGSVDNSVHFEAGSIVIQASEFSNAEAEKFAKMIMEKIKRQNEINSMLKYQTV